MNFTGELVFVYENIKFDIPILVNNHLDMNDEAFTDKSMITVVI